MVSTDDALKFIKERAKRKKRTKPSSTSAASPFSSSSRKGEKRKDPKPSLRPTKGSQRWRKESQIVEGAEVVSVQFAPNPSIYLDPRSFKSFPSLCSRMILLSLRNWGRLV